jgi:hypothetical protein
MSRWRLFSRSEKIQTTEKINKDQNEIKIETNEKEDEITHEDPEENKFITNYSETLYSDTSKSKKIRNKPSTDQRMWRDIGLIEEKIDNLHTTLVKKYASEIEKKVDHLVSGIKIEEPKTIKKTSTIVYILKKPKLDKLRGNWTVQNNGIISTHHKIKENAIIQAKKIARKKNAKIMIQNFDKSFSEVF